MTQTESGVRNHTGRSLAARLAWLVLILATLYICYFHNLGAIGLVGPDEPRYAWIARDMAETGDWVTPRLYGKPWFEKPVLYYWGAALCFKLFGVSEAAARLPSAFSALLATLPMAWLAWRAYGAETARWALLLLPTTVGMIGFSHAAAPDMLFAAMLTVAMVFAGKLVGVLKSPERGEVKENAQGPRAATRTAWFWSFTSFTSSTSFNSCLWGVFLGLAVLAKGPAAIILASGGVLLWALFTKRWRDAFRCLQPVGIVSFCLTALPWYLLCARRNSDFFRVFIIEHNFKRYLTPEFQHIQPFWFYIPILLIATFPWTLVLLWSAGPGPVRWWRTKCLSPFALLLLSYVIFCFIFFSASKSKLPGYILPVVPVLGVFLGRAMTSLRLRKSAVASLFLSALISVAGAAALFGPWGLLPPRFGDSQRAVAVLFAGLVPTFGLLALALKTKSNSYTQTLLQTFGFATFLVVIALLSETETMSRTGLSSLSAKSVANTVKAYGGTPENIRLVGLKRSTQYQLAFYLHGGLREWNGQVNEGDLVLGEHISCQRLKLNSGCVDLWGWLDMPGDWVLLKISRATQ